LFIEILDKIHWWKIDYKRLHRPDLGCEDLHWMLHHDYSVIICEKKSHKGHIAPKIIVQA
jgi:hypothetical protein